MLRCCLVAALSLFTSGALAQDVTFLLTNSTSYPISEMHLSPPNLNFWGHNSLRAPALKVGESHQVSVAPYATECIQDILVVFADNASQAIWQGLNMCNLTRISLFFDRISGVTTAKYNE